MSPLENSIDHIASSVASLSISSTPSHSHLTHPTPPPSSTTPHLPALYHVPTPPYLVVGSSWLCSGGDGASDQLGDDDQEFWCACEWTTQLRRQAGNTQISAKDHGYIHKTLLGVV